MTFEYFKKPHKWLILCSIFIYFSFTPPPQIEVPDTMLFAGIKLKLNQGVRRQIQSQLNYLLKNKKQIKANLSQIKLYLHIAGEILDKEGAPNDLKYLAIQENNLSKNGLISTDGFWKLKESLALELGLKVNEKVDERLNIISASQQVSQYLKRNNLYFKNWLFSILSLELGFYEAKQFCIENYKRSEIAGVQVLQIDERIHPYIRTFLVYKLFFEEILQENAEVKFRLTEFYKGANKTLLQIARKFDVSSEEVAKYNTWLKKKRIPTDKVYAVLIPISIKSNRTKPQQKSLAVHDNAPLSDDDFVKPVEWVEDKIDEQEKEDSVSSDEADGIEDKDFVQEEFDKNSKVYPKRVKPTSHTVLLGQTLFGIAKMYEVSVNDLREWNNLSHNDKIYVGQILKLSQAMVSNTYPESQQNQSGDMIHTVQQGESLFTIAQMYQISVAHIRIWNQLDYNHIIEVGDRLIVGKSRGASPKLQSPHPSNKQTINPNQPQQNKTSFSKKINQGKTIQKLSETSEGLMRGAAPIKKNKVKEMPLPQKSLKK